MENFSKISQALKSARVSSGLSLDDVQKITKIKPEYLQSIDDSNPKLIQDDFYLKMFVQRYADAVNLDISSLLNNEKAETRTSRNTAMSETAILNDSSSARYRLFSNLKTIGLVLAILAGLAAFWFYSVNDNTNTNKDIEDTIQISSKEPTSSNSKLNDANQEKQLATKLNGPEFEQATASFICEDEVDHKVVIQVGSPTWIEVIIDNVQMFAGMMAGGNEQEFDFGADNTNVTIHTGNSRETGISFDGEVLNFKDGSPIEINNITIDR